jgi:threonine dehydrogenase-like Zn-dependent dehydrogenase
METVWSRFRRELWLYSERTIAGEFKQMRGQALWYVAAGRAELREAQAPDPQPDEVRVRALHGAISRGTEALVMGGRVPASEHARMRGPSMGGNFPFPVKYGYATVGEVEAGTTQGRTVFALHPHQTHFTLPASAVVPVPDDVPPARAILAANMETALNAVWDGAPAPADRIVVIGAGVVGALVAWLCASLRGAEVTLVDTDPSRAILARTLGVRFALPAEAPHDCDVVFHASGNGAGLATALACAGEEAKVVELSWYGAGDVALPLGGAFHSCRLTIMSSQVGKVAVSHRARWPYARRLTAALALLSDERLDALLAPPVKFSDLPKELPRILAPGSGVLCQRIDYT